MLNTKPAQPNAAVNQIPPATEIDCIEVPKVFDECLIKQCLTYIPNADPTNPLGSDYLRMVINNFPGTSSVIEIGPCYNFRLDAINISQTPMIDSDYKNISLSFNIVFDVDVFESSMAAPITETFVIPRTINNIQLYCPDPKAMIYTIQAGNVENLTPDIKKIEMVAECRSISWDFDDTTRDLTINVALGFNMIVKCELETQLQVLSRGYCPTPQPCKPNTPCNDFLNSPPPEFFPSQKVM